MVRLLVYRQHPCYLRIWVQSHTVSGEATLSLSVIIYTYLNLSDCVTPLSYRVCHFLPFYKVRRLHVMFMDPSSSCIKFGAWACRKIYYICTSMAKFSSSWVLHLLSDWRPCMYMHYCSLAGQLLTELFGSTTGQGLWSTVCHVKLHSQSCSWGPKMVWESNISTNQLRSVLFIQ